MRGRMRATTAREGAGNRGEGALQRDGEHGLEGGGDRGLVVGAGGVVEGAGHGGGERVGGGGEDRDGLVLAAAAAQGAGGELAEALQRVGEGGERRRLGVGERAQRGRALHGAERAGEAAQGQAQRLDALGAAHGELQHQALQRGDARGGVAGGLGVPPSVNGVEGAAQLGVDEAGVRLKEAPDLGVHAGLGEDGEVLGAGGPVGGVEEGVGGVGGAVPDQRVERARHGGGDRAAQGGGALAREAGQEEAAGRGPAILHALAAALVVLEAGALAVDEVEQGAQLALVGHGPLAAAVEGHGLALEQPVSQALVELVGARRAAARLARPAAEHEEALQQARLQEEHVELAHQHHRRALAA